MCSTQRECGQRTEKQQSHRSNSSVRFILSVPGNMGAYPRAPVFPALGRGTGLQCCTPCFCLRDLRRGRQLSTPSLQEASSTACWLPTSEGLGCTLGVPGQAPGRAPHLSLLRDPSSRLSHSPQNSLSFPCKHLLPLLPFEVKLWECHTRNLRATSLASECAPIREHLLLERNFNQVEHTDKKPNLCNEKPCSSGSLPAPRCTQHSWSVCTLE